MSFSYNRFAWFRLRVSSSQVNGHCNSSILLFRLLAGVDSVSGDSVAALFLFHYIFPIISDLN